MMTRNVSTARHGHFARLAEPNDRLTANRRQTLTVGAALAGMIALGTQRRASAQGTDAETTVSEEKLRQLGNPEIVISVGLDGVDAPLELAEGRYLVSLTAAAPYVAYPDFMQPPAGVAT